MTPTIALVLMVLKATCLLLIALCATLALQRATARTRHIIWLAALVAVVALPMLSTWAPWKLPILPASAPVAGTVISPRPEAAPSRTAIGLTSDAAPAENAAPTTNTATSPRRIAWTAFTIVLLAWAAVAALLLAWLAWGAIQVRRIVRRSQPLDDQQWQGSLYEIADRLGLATAPRLLRSEDVKMPFASGLLHPTIVLPAASDEWTADRRTAVLIHELGHVKRRDLVGHTVGRLACALYWFHPLAWTAARNLRAESERACDDLALTFGTRPSDYAEHLLDIVTCVRNHETPSVALALAHRKEFEGRMLAILNPELRRKGMGRAGTSLLVVSLMLLAVAVGGAMPVERTAVAVPVPPTVTADVDQPATPVTPDAPKQVEANVIPAPRPQAKPASVTAANRTAEQVMAQAKPGAKAGTDSTDDERANVLARTLRTDADPSVRRIAAWGLAQYGDETVAADALVAALNTDKDATVREMSAWALASVHSSTAVVQALGKAASQSSDPKLQATAIWALGSAGDDSSVEVLVPALSSPDAKSRAMAAWAIGSISPQKAPAQLTKGLTDPDRQVRSSTIWALFTIADPSTLPALEAAFAKETDQQLRLEMVRAIGAMGEPAVDALSRLVSSPDSSIRMTAVTALASGRASGPWPMPRPMPRPFP